MKALFTSSSCSLMNSSNWLMAAVASSSAWPCKDWAWSMCLSRTALSCRVEKKENMVHKSTGEILQDQLTRSHLDLCSTNCALRVFTLRWVLLTTASSCFSKSSRRPTHWKVSYRKKDYHAEANWKSHWADEKHRSPIFCTAQICQVCGWLEQWPVNNWAIFPH